MVLDTSSLVTALRSSKGAAAELLRLIILEKFTLLMDYKLASEYRDVALRREHLVASKQTAGDVKELIEILESLAEPVSVIHKSRPLSPDPDDDMVLDVAINGDADAIVTQNSRHFNAAASRFAIRVLTPNELIAQIRKGK
jgi:putative PIN family toxin of toxin-antitoxin system